MCGILGIIGKDHSALVEKLSQTLCARGKDHYGIHSTQEFTVAHSLHAIVGHVPQPLVKDKAVFAANCEIYNYQEFSENGNDAQGMFQLFLEKGVEKSIGQLDGDFAFLFLHENTLIFGRDRIGVKPLWFTQTNEIFAVCSEAKMIHQLGLEPHECSPAAIYTFNIQNRQLNTYTYWQPPVKELSEESSEIIARNVLTYFRSSIKKRAQIKKAAVLFSGGVDSTFVAKELSAHGVEVHLYTAAYQHGNIASSRDLMAAREAASTLKLPLREVIVDMPRLKEELPRVLEIIELTNPVQVSVALPIYFCCKQAATDGHRIMFSGLGSEEIFAGYQRHGLAKDINAECIAGLTRMHATDLYRDDLLTIHHALELRVPFLDKDLVEYTLTIPGKFKIQGNTKKFILREAALLAEMAEKTALRPKLAAQYGSNFQKGLEQLAQGNIQKLITSFKKNLG